MGRSEGFISHDGVPKICVPFMGAKRSDIIDSLRYITNSAADFAEWRLDYYENADNIKDVLETAGIVRDALGKLPLLVTFRTANEGGIRDISFDDYSRMLLDIAESGMADMIDVEVFFDGMGSDINWDGEEAFSYESPICKLVSGLKKNVAVIGSYHDFNGTPKIREMVGRLCFAAKCGVDIPKLAVMPHKEEDVLSLLQATIQAKRQLALPIITMSMGKIGAVSRFLGESFGSSVTFGHMGKESAPGQINADSLKGILDSIHRELL